MGWDGRRCVGVPAGCARVRARNGTRTPMGTGLPRSRSARHGLGRRNPPPGSRPGGFRISGSEPGEGWETMNFDLKRRPKEKFRPGCKWKYWLAPTESGTGHHSYKTYADGVTGIRFTHAMCGHRFGGGRCGNLCYYRCMQRTCPLEPGTRNYDMAQRDVTKAALDATADKKEG